MFSSVWQSLSGPFRAAGEFFASGLLVWLVVGLLVIIGCALAGWFFEKARPYLGVVAVAVIGFIAGGFRMWLKMLDKDREAARKQLEHKVEQQIEHSTGWRWPWQ